MVKQKHRARGSENAELAYEAPLGNGAKARYAVTSTRKLQVEYDSGAAKRQYSIDLLALDPRSKRWKEKIRQTSKVDRGLLLGLILAVVTVIAVLLTRLPFIYAAIVASVTAILAVYLVRRNKTAPSRMRKHVFVSRRAQVPMVEITYNRKSKNLEQFVEQLARHIETAMAACELDEKELLAGELRALRRLVDNGFLEKRRYEKAKRYLLTITN